jgi:toxin ParE1/3/4
MKSLRYHPLFADDVLEAAGWYAAQNPTLGNTFVEHVAEAVRLLIQNPERRGSGELGVRYWPLRKFPFVVFYEVTADALLIVGVMHTARDAEKWILRRR